MNPRPEIVSDRDEEALLLYGVWLGERFLHIDDEAAAEEFYRLDEEKRAPWYSMADSVLRRIQAASLGSASAVPLAEHHKIVRELKRDSEREIARLERAIVNLVLTIGRAGESRQAVPHLGKVT